MPKRGHGEGNIRKRPDGRWEARVSTQSGRRSFYGSSRAEVARKLAVALGELQRGTYLDTPAISVAEFLDDWLENSVRHSVRLSTYEVYEIHVRLHLKPALGHIRLDKLTAQQVQRMMTARIDEGLSPHTVNTSRKVLRTALGQAVKWRMLHYNAASEANRATDARRKEAPLTIEQAQRFIESLEGDHMQAFFMTALMLGLRHGEVCALRWQDVDLNAATLSVNQTVRRTMGAVRFTPPKTRSSQRTLRIPPLLLDRLKEHRAHYNVVRQIARDDWEDFDLVFPSSRGTPLERGRVLMLLKQRLRAAGLPEIRFHDLRHACATLLLAKGVDIQVVKEIMGHANIATTADLYAHVLPTLRDDAASRMNQIFDSGS